MNTMQNSIPAGLSLLMALQDAAASGEVSPTTKTGKPTVFGGLASTVAQPAPTTPGMPEAAGMAQVAGGIAATQEAEKKKMIDQLLSQMSQGQQPPMMPGGAPQQPQAQMMPGAPQQPQQPQAQMMARGGIAQFADGGTAIGLPASVPAPRLEDAVTQATGITGVSPERMAALEAAQNAELEGRKAMPLAKAAELAAIEEAAAQRAALEKQYQADANKREFYSYFAGLGAGGLGGAGATRQKQLESERQNRIREVERRADELTKAGAIRDLQAAQRQGNLAAATAAAEKLLEIDAKSRENVGRLAGTLNQSAVAQFNAQLDYLASRQNASEQVKATAANAAAGRLPTGEVKLILDEQANILARTVPKGQTATPAQISAALAEAIKTVRPAVSSREGIAAEKSDEGVGKEFSKQLTEAMGSFKAPKEAKNPDEYTRYRNARAREIGRALGMTDADIDRRLGIKAPDAAPAAPAAGAPAARPPLGSFNR